MKKLIYPFVAFILLSFAKDSSTGLSPEDRKMMLKYLTETRDHLKEVLDGLSEEQLNFQADPTSWSIAQCVEHLALTERTFSEIVHKSVAEGPKPSLKDSLVFKDEQIMPMVVDRSNKVKTSEPFEPSGKFGSTDETLAAFIDGREALIAYVKITEDDLRNRFNSDLPFGTVDVVQFIVFAAGHCERHILQMEEVMDHEDFPEME
ncbi:DinB family protein [Flagellimonas crocea]|uniref:DinB family protein n=1 Tax=Flagellimonas crocea TaxID=3067311 RepID=UPI00296F9269|nr:DinB family protein [Muricauda sp. DH64]